MVSPRSASAPTPTLVAERLVSAIGETRKRLICLAANGVFPLPEQSCLVPLQML